MKRSKLYVVAALLLLAAIGFSCQLENEFHNPTDAHHHGEQRIQTLTGAAAQNIRQKLLSTLNRKGSTIQLFDITEAAARTSSGSIDFSSILAVIDSIGVKNYTFKVVNHPLDNARTFHNLILTDKAGELEVTLMKYEMNEEFAAQFNANLKPFQEFKGEVTASDLSTIETPCEEVSVTIGDQPTPPESGGGIQLPDPGNGNGSTYPAAGDPSGGGGDNGCITGVSISYQCSCGRSYPNWDDYSSSFCGNGTYPGYTYSIVITYTISPSCRMADDPCNPAGIIGILPPKKNPFDCLTAAKLQEIFPNASAETIATFYNQLKQYGSKFGIDSEKKLAHFLAQVKGETGGIALLDSQENLNYTTAASLVRTWPTKFSTSNPNLTPPYNYINNPQLLANFVYCCRMGNGDQNSGDGWLYRGRGIFQLTFKNNYTNYLNYLAANNITVPYTHPNDLTDPNQLHAVLSGLWYFKTKILDTLDVENAEVNAVTNRVNSFVNANNRQIRMNTFNLSILKLNC
jgi:putative chitinase